MPSRTKRGETVSIGDVLDNKPIIRMMLMAEIDKLAVQTALELKGQFRDLAEQLGLTILHYGIKKPSRSGMIKVVVRDGQGVNLPPRSPEFRKFVRIVQPHHLWLAWVAVESIKTSGGKKCRNNRKDLSTLPDALSSSSQDQGKLSPFLPLAPRLD